MIKFDNVTKIYPGDQLALSEINLAIERGEFVFLVGPGGAGKSTFMKMLFREEIPTAGCIYVDGKCINELVHDEVPYHRRKLGIIFQDVRLLPNKSIFDNVAFAMKVIEAPYGTVKRRVTHVLDMVGLRDRMKAYPRELSGGEQQRVAIARAIVNRPHIVIADEPTGNLDPETSRGIVDIFEKINAGGTTVIMATHDKTIVDRMLKRVIAIENGAVVRDEAEGMYGYEN